VTSSSSALALARKLPFWSRSVSLGMKVKPSFSAVSSKRMASPRLACTLYQSVSPEKRMLPEMNASLWMFCPW
jgi:hypothetical protein